ncbi:MAG: hypothetical protein SNJ56_04040 [Termitinemataceae bacterium]
MQYDESDVNTIGVTDMCSAQKQDFLYDQFFVMSWSAAVQRIRTFNEDVDENQKAEFKNNVKNYIITNILPAYSKGSVDENTHVKNIKRAPLKTNQKL